MKMILVSKGGSSELEVGGGGRVNSMKPSETATGVSY